MSGIYIVRLIELCAWITFIDTLVGILTDSVGFMEGMV